MALRFAVPSLEHPTIDAVFEELRTLDLSTFSSSPSLIEVILQKGVYTCTMEFGCQRNTDLGIGLLINAPIFDRVDVIVQGNGSTLNGGIRILNGKNIAINDLHVKNTSRSNLGYGVFCQNTTATFNRCTITNCSTIGLWCYLNSCVSISATRVEDNKDTGVAVYFASFDARASTIVNNGNHGLLVSGNTAKCRVEDTSIKNHATTGIWCLDKAMVEVKGGKISGNNDGLFADSGGQVTHTNCQLYANEMNVYEDDGGSVKETEIGWETDARKK
jgi:hypothetical protein